LYPRLYPRLSKRRASRKSVFREGGLVLLGGEMRHSPEMMEADAGAGFKTEFV
jgi:hypothetical protein